jgi:hypothetical protein
MNNDTYSRRQSISATRVAAVLTACAGPAAIVLALTSCSAGDHGGNAPVSTAPSSVASSPVAQSPNPGPSATQSRGSAAAGSGLAPTQIINEIAVNSSGQPANGYHETTGPTPDRAAECNEPSPAAVSNNIYGCAPSAYSADVCWPASGLDLLCMNDPWAKEVHRIHVPAPLNQSPHRLRPNLWRCFSMTALTAESEMAARGVVATTATLAPTVATQMRLCLPGRTPADRPVHAIVDRQAWRPAGIWATGATARHPQRGHGLVCQQLKTLRAAETQYCPGISAQIPPPTTPKCLVNRSPPWQNTEREPSQVSSHETRNHVGFGSIRESNGLSHLPGPHDGLSAGRSERMSRNCVPVRAIIERRKNLPRIP